MNSNEPNKIVSKLYKEVKKLQALPSEKIDEYFAKIEPIKKQLEDITRVVGAIEVMSKANILKLSAMESSLRFMEPFKFLMYLSKANDDLNK